MNVGDSESTREDSSVIIPRDELDEYDEETDFVESLPGGDHVKELKVPMAHVVRLS